VIVVRVQFFADHTAFVETAGGAKHVGQFNGAAMGACANFGNGGFPVRPAAHLISVAAAFLGYWHGWTSLFLLGI
jgi:hypothetical protein